MRMDAGSRLIMNNPPAIFPIPIIDTMILVIISGAVVKARIRAAIPPKTKQE
jgi:hypothetical protein